MQHIFVTIATILFLGSSIQAFNADLPQNHVLPGHIQRLKKLTCILSDPKFNFKANANDKDLDKIFDFMGDLRYINPEAQFRTVRAISDLIKEVSKRIKDVVTKITEPFEKLSNKIKDFFAQITKPFKKVLKFFKKKGEKKSL